MKDLAMYILVNSDIEISAGKLGGQVGHVVQSYMDTIIEAKDDYDCHHGFYATEEAEKLIDLYNEYKETNRKKIILKCKQSKLETLLEKYPFVRDCGLTELEPNTLTCVCLGIIDRNNIPEDLKFIKRLRLY